MRQVPDISTFLLIGSGKLAKHLQSYFDAQGIPFLSWNRRSLSIQDLSDKISACGKVLLCINDDAIEAFYSEWRRPDKIFVHFSGTLDVPGLFGFHPLMSFGDIPYEHTVYKDIHFVGTHPSEDFRKVFPELNNPYSTIRSSDKSLYHSLCVLSGNGTTLLWQLVQKEFEKIGLPEEALFPYLKQITNNILEKQEGRFSGPWYRKDLKTIQLNETALSNSPLQSLYFDFEKLTSHRDQSNEKH